MCGRYSLTAPADELVEVFGPALVVVDHEPRYNIAPTQEAPALIQASDGRRIGPLRWGLVPFWADDPSIGNGMINARSETVGEKPAFREAFRRRRCLVLADGFYEWTRNGRDGPKRPHWIHLPSRRPFPFAGIWERWKPEEDAEPLHTFAILTADAAPSIRSLHPRMPVILPPEAWDPWLEPETPPGALHELLGPYGGELCEHEVSTYVNAPANEGPRCVEPVRNPS